jgi:hypothetical protein
LLLLKLLILQLGSFGWLFGSLGFPLVFLRRLLAEVNTQYGDELLVS